MYVCVLVYVAHPCFDIITVYENMLACMHEVCMCVRATPSALHYMADHSIGLSYVTYPPIVYDSTSAMNSATEKEEKRIMACNMYNMYAFTYVDVCACNSLQVTSKRL